MSFVLSRSGYVDRCGLHLLSLLLIRSAPQPWLRQVCGIVLEPVQTAIRAEDPLPVIQGHLVDCRGQRIDLLSHHEILRNLWLSQLRTSCPSF